MVVDHLGDVLHHLGRWPLRAPRTEIFPRRRRRLLISALRSGARRAPELIWQPQTRLERPEAGLYPLGSPPPAPISPAQRPPGRRLAHPRQHKKETRSRGANEAPTAQADGIDLFPGGRTLILIPILTYPYLL